MQVCSSEGCLPCMIQGLRAQHASRPSNPMDTRSARYLGPFSRSWVSRCLLEASGYLWEVAEAAFPGILMGLIRLWDSPLIEGSRFSWEIPGRGGPGKPRPNEWPCSPWCRLSWKNTERLSRPAWGLEICPDSRWCASPISPAYRARTCPPCRPSCLYGSSRAPTVLCVDAP